MKKIFSFILTIIVAQLTMAATYTRVTSAPADWSGQYLVVYDNSGNADKGLVFKGEDAAMNTVEATITNGQIVADNLSEYAVEIAPMTGGYSIKVLRTGNYMGGKNGANTTTSSPAFKSALNEVVSEAAAPTVKYIKSPDVFALYVLLST